MLSRSRPLLLPLFLLQPADAAQDAQPHDTVVGPLLRGLVGGAGYGFAAAAISHPFDTIKVRLQSGGAAKAGSASVGGLLSLYRGVGPATAASIVPFVGYEATRSWLRAHGLLEERPLAAALLGGAVGGAMRGCLETPAELVKTRLQLQSAWSLPLLLRGLSSTVFRNAAMIGLFWAAFEASAPLRSRLPPLAASFVGGGGCSVLAWAAAFPLDTANVVAQLGRIYSERGIAGWYAGLGAGLTRAFLANGGGMAFYSLIQAALTESARPACDASDR
ncbi:hypothetical protein EMIHUDRAFT_242478 [Emiliania huxleyi CCMP1516]|uniref:Mitochondrial carrier protein n=2 Tax=Emiliania huxleyi TaxID=2903 RepID=A0A0D3J8M5_EMIH1|nr:hypothetical protein EMIHUDRAFT_242478 [Emiliania huxleyi CCMP1516]EOD19860.1 hypothetical protein EMIHUDRAFT_242478 [Emiliania huxleyi CCMP1516]|eukprot:XP_005772289.1 hypothetical protein EMIHUDRAFT_242478 [Emiliania huxleyi CCMP1516]